MGTHNENCDGHKEILCIEEHGEICLLLSKMLDDDSFTILHAKNPERAEAMLLACTPDLVVIENNFSGLAGMSYVSDLKHQSPGLKILMLSAEGGVKKDAYSQAGVDIFLIKPFTKMQLVRSVVLLVNG